MRDARSQNKTGREPRRELSRYQVIIIPYSRGAGREVGRVKLVEKLAEKKRVDKLVYKSAEKLAE